METQQKDMMERMTALLPLEKQTTRAASDPSNTRRGTYFGVSRNILPRREAFEVLYHLNCDNLCSDFQEDLSFKFSLGLTCLVNRFMAGSNAKKRQYPSGVPRPMSNFSTPETPSHEFVIPSDDWSLVSKIALASLSSQGTMGGLLIGGLLLKTVGWRVIAVSGAIYGTISLYERITRTNQAKLKEFKRQYVDHAARKLRLIVDMTSANCSHQVQQELSSTFARLCHLVDESTAEMKDNAKTMDRNIKELEEIAAKAKEMKDNAKTMDRNIKELEEIA